LLYTDLVSVTHIYIHPAERNVTVGTNSTDSSRVYRHNRREPNEMQLLKPK